MVLALSMILNTSKLAHMLSKLRNGEWLRRNDFSLSNKALKPISTLM